MDVGISFIVPWCNRPEISKTLAANQVVFEKRESQQLIVNCGGDISELEFLCKEAKVKNTKIININTPQFNKSLALNIGAHYAKHNMLFFLDADIVFKEDFISIVQKKILDDSFFTIERVFESNKKDDNEKKVKSLLEIAYFTQFICPRNKSVTLETNRVRFNDGSRSAPGLLLINRHNFISIDGMNSDLQFWGWEDLDIIVRAQLDLGLTHNQMGSVIHLSHDDVVRNLGGLSRNQCEMSNFSLCLSNYARGNFKGTYAKDLKKWKSKITEINLAYSH